MLSGVPESPHFDDADSSLRLARQPTLSENIKLLKD